MVFLPDTKEASLRIGWSDSLLFSLLLACRQRRIWAGCGAIVTEEAMSDWVPKTAKTGEETI
jgi:hypothetical protein